LVGDPSQQIKDRREASGSDRVDWGVKLGSRLRGLDRQARPSPSGDSIGVSAGPRRAQGLKRGENRVRAETNFASRINLIWVVQFFGAKYYFRFSEICASSLAIPPRCKGRFAIVTNVRWDAVAATERETSAFRLRTVKPCGSGAPKQASSSQDANASRG
jgi:hypothetical protein